MELPDTTKLLAVDEPMTASLREVAIVNTTHFNPEAALCMVVAYDHSMLASTQGRINPRKAIASAWWPTAEFGGMELGYGWLGFRKDGAIADSSERGDCHRKNVAEFCTAGTTASVFEIDNAIDPAEARRRIKAGLRLVQCRLVPVASAGVLMSGEPRRAAGVKGSHRIADDSGASG